MLKPNFNLDNIGEHPTFTVPENIVDIHEEPNFNYEDPRIQEITRI